MAKRKQIIWDVANNKYSGFIDHGPLEAKEILASEALVFQLVGIRSHWKQPIGYFLTDKMPAATQASLINMALIMASNAGLKVWCVTCDGTTTNISTFKQLGCSFGQSYDSIVTKFQHPSTGDDVFAILDACHMLKLARNALAFLGTICSNDGEKIQWKFFHSLHLIQEQQGLKLDNKLSANHIEFEKHTMNVKLAAQTLSGSVPNAIDGFMDISQKQPEFQDSKGTVAFIRTLDRLFDMLNSRNPHGKGFKQPLKLADINKWKVSLESTAKYLLTLKSNDGEILITHRRKTFILCFVITLKSTVEMAKKMLTMEGMPFKYVLTYKYSQDHIGLLFSCIRAKGGWNNNPNSLQLKYALRRMLLENAVTASAHANCQILDNNATIPIFHKRKHVAPLIEESPPDATNESQSNQAQLSRLVSQLELNKQSNYVLNILYYISGCSKAHETSEMLLMYW